MNDDTTNHGARRDGVMVVSAEADARTRTAEVLDEAGFDVVQAGSGGEAMALDLAPFSAVVLDVDLPDSNGFKLCQELRVRAATRTLPVVYVCGAGVDEQHRFAALESGADACLAQPLDPVVLVSTVRALTRARAAELAQGEAAAADTAGGAAVPVEVAALAHEMLDQIDLIADNARAVLTHRVDDSTLVALNAVLASTRVQGQLMADLLEAAPEGAPPVPPAASS